MAGGVEREQRGVEERGREQRGEDDGAAEVERAFELDAEGHVGAEERAEELAGRLGRALRPAVLLLPPRRGRFGELGRDLDLARVDEPPAAELGAVREVEVFGERVGLPAAGVFDGGLSPEAGGAVEAHEAARRRARPLLDGEVVVQQGRLHARECRAVAIEVAPARLHERHVGVGEGRREAGEEVGRRHEVGVQHADQFGPVGGGVAEAVGERAGLVARAGGAADVVHVHAAVLPERDARGDERLRLVRRVVEDLEREAAGVGEPRARIDDALGDGALVVERELHEHGGPVVICPVCLRQRRRRPIPPRAPRHPQQVQPEHAQHDHGGGVEPGEDEAEGREHSAGSDGESRKNAPARDFGKPARRIDRSVMARAPRGQARAGSSGSGMTARSSVKPSAGTGTAASAA